jgi:hypothetical protein
VHDGSETVTGSFSVSLTDGGGGATPTATVNATVTPVNDDPTIAGDLTIALNEGASVVVTTADLNALDPDTANPNLIFTVTGTTNGFVALTGAPGTPITSFTQADLAASSVLFVHDGSETVTGSFSVSLTDGGGGATPTATVNATVTPVNDAPDLAHVATSATYPPGGAPVVLAPALTISDVDSATLSGATVHINSATTFLGDVLAADGVSSGVLPDFTNITASYNAGNATLTLSGSDTLLHYQQALQTVTFQSTSATPTNGGANAVRTVEWQVNDGSGVNNLSNVPITDIKLHTLDLDADDSTVSGTGYATTFTEKGPAVAVAGDSSSDVTINDADLTGVRKITSATVTLTDAKTGDSLAVSGSLSGGISATIDNSVVGQITVTLSGGSATGAASITDYQTALHQVVFNNSSSTPDTTNRDISIVVRDSLNIDTNLAHATVAVIAVDDKPVLDAHSGAPGGSLTFTENAAATAIDTALTVTDADSANLSGASVSITSNFHTGEDVLGFVDQNGIAGSYDPGTGVLTLSGTSSVANYEAALRSVSYFNSSENPSGTVRTISYQSTDDVGTASDVVTTTVAVTPVNDAPTATITPTSYSATEQTSLGLKNTGLSVSDVDGNLGAETATLSVAEGTLTVTAGGSGATVNNSGTSSVTITGTLAEINALLNTDGTSTVSYIDNIDDPSASTVLTLAINDNGNTGTGGSHTGSDTATINITPVNDAPGLTNVAATADYTENAAAVTLAPSILITDPDPFPHGAPGGNGMLLSATIKIASGFVAGDELRVFDTTLGTSSTSGDYVGINVHYDYDNTTHVLTLSGSDTIIDYDHVLENIQFASTSDDPANGGGNPTRTITWQVQDAGGTANGGTDLSVIGPGTTTTLTVHPINDAPVAAITPTTYSATEQTALSLKNNGLAVSDVDGSAGSETVTLSVGEGVLNVTPGGSGAVVNNSGTNAVTITGTVAQINALLNTDGTSTVSYIGNTDTPSASTPLTLLIHDNGNTGTGGDHSSSDTATINITAVNDAPVFANLGGASHPNFVENGYSVVLDNNVTVSDPELNAAGNYGGATLTLARNGGANPDDAFAGTGTLDLAHSNGSGENVSLDGGATFIGTFAQPGDGTFSITFNAGATATNVAFVMQHIGYANASENPEASVQIDWAFNDGNTGAQGTGGAAVGTGSVTVDITQVDDAPVLINVAPSAGYVPGTSGAVLSSTLGIFDPDAVAPSPLQGLASATVKIESGFFAGDKLFVNLASSGGHFVTPDGDTTNISVQSNVLGTLMLSGNDTVAHYQSVLDAVSYQSTAADPSNGGADPTRNISWQVNDGALNSQTPNPDPNNLVNETVLHFDLAPQLDLDASGAGTGFTTTFIENGAPIAIVDTDVSIVDPDNANLDSATVVLTNAKATDALSIVGAMPGGIDSSIDTSTPGQITLHLFNSASLADYQTALGQVRFVNSSDTPDTTDRDITVSVTNGADSNVAHATIHVTAVDDAPVAANASAGGSEDTPISGIVSAPDVDNTPSQLSYALVGANGGAAHGAVVFHADGSYTYNPVHDFNGSDSFSFKAKDGHLDSNAATVSLAVGAVNDAPVAANASASGNEDTVINGKVSATDVDNTAGQLSYNLVGTNGGAAHGTLVFHADGTFTYTPASNFNGSDSFSFKANDGALDSNVATESLTINAVNDAPVNTVPGPLNAQNGLDAAIIGLAVSDVDAVSLTTSLHVDHGTLSVAAVGGATVIGSGTGTVTLSGSVAQIDAALGAPNNVLYQSAFNFVGTDHLTMTSNDGGGTGSGGPQTDTDVVDINAGHSMGAFLAFSILGSSDFHLH